MKMKSVLFMSVLAIFFLLSACEPIPGTGTFVIHLHCQYYEDNPEALDGDLGLHSLIQIEGLTPEYYIGDTLGTITVHGVPKGTYTIHPLFMSPDYDITMTSVADQTTEETIVIPDLTLQFYFINPSSLEDVNFRKALAQTIDRTELISNVSLISSDAEPLYTMLPSGFLHDGLDLTAAFTETGTALSGAPAGGFAITYNTNDAHQAIANEIINQWGLVSGTVSTVDLTFDELNTRIASQDYDIARSGWIMDANNPISFLKLIFDSTGYTSTDYETIIAALEQAQADALAGTDYLSLEDFLDYTDQLHSIIIDQGLAIPLYEY